MKFLKQDQHFVVMATHPDLPNYGPQARGRKLHLATSHRKKLKTLCNMLVVEGVERQSYMADRDMCLTCVRRSKEVIKQRFDGVTYSSPSTPMPHTTQHTAAYRHGRVG